MTAFIFLALYFLLDSGMMRGEISITKEMP